MFVIRADGNAKIGAGHIMRCLTIAEALAKQGHQEEILFFCADAQSAELVKDHGFKAFVLETDYRDMESELPTWAEKLRMCRAPEEAPLKVDCPEAEQGLPMQQLSHPIILVDSYFVNDVYLTALGRFGFVVLMDDMERKAYPVDAVINYNAPASLAAYEELYRGTDTKLFIGSTFVPVREQFLGRTCEIRKEVKTVLITTGGGDSENIAGQILQTLYEETKEFHLVVGQFNPHFEELKALENTRQNIHIHSNVKDMAGLMAASDLCITAGGSTIYELAALGVPFICFSYAENQEALTEYIGAQKTAGFAGAYHKKPQETLQNMKALFQKLSADIDLRRSYYDSEKKLVDGRGAERLAEILRKLT